MSKPHTAGIHHTPVLVGEVLQGLDVRKGGTYVDATLGEGGHARAILEASSPGGRLLGLDLDPQALEAARQRLQPFWPVATLLKGNYALVGHLARVFGFSGVDGVLFDLGLSSLQLEGERRGFSFLRAEPLDMRFDPEQELTADTVVNSYSAHELTTVLREYGEERRADRIVKAIVESRPIRDSLQLAEVVARAVGRRRSALHPATRTFQAIRIEVNKELMNLERGLEQAIQLLRPGGRLVVISYHSLEDRIVKQLMQREAQDCICPPGTPVCTCGHVATLRVVTKKVVRPGSQEVKANPRSRSARLRVAERTAPTWPSIIPLK